MKTRLIGLTALITLMLAMTVYAAEFNITDVDGTTLLSLDNATGNFNITTGEIAEGGIFLQYIYAKLAGFTMAGNIAMGIYDINGTGNLSMHDGTFTWLHPSEIRGYFSATCGAGTFIRDIADDGTFDCSGTLGADYWNVSNVDTTELIANATAGAGADLDETELFNLSESETVTGADTTFNSNVTVNGNLTVDSPTFHVNKDDDRVGVGIITPSYTFEVADTGASTAVNLSDVFFVDAQYNGVGILTKSPDAALDVHGQLRVNHTTFPLNISENETERMIINSTGEITFYNNIMTTGDFNGTTDILTTNLYPTNIVNYYSAICAAGTAVADIADDGTFTCRDIANADYYNVSGDTLTGNMDAGIYDINGTGNLSMHDGTFTWLHPSEIRGYFGAACGGETAISDIADDGTFSCRDITNADYWNVSNVDTTELIANASSAAHGIDLTELYNLSESENITNNVNISAEVVLVATNLNLTSDSNITGGGTSTFTIDSTGNVIFRLG